MEAPCSEVACFQLSEAGDKIIIIIEAGLHQLAVFPRTPGWALSPLIRPSMAIPAFFCVALGIGKSPWDSFLTYYQATEIAHTCKHQVTDSQLLPNKIKKNYSWAMLVKLKRAKLSRTKSVRRVVIYSSVSLPIHIWWLVYFSPLANWLPRHKW